MASAGTPGTKREGWSWLQVMHTRLALLCFQQLFVLCKTTVMVFEKRPLSYLCVSRLGQEKVSGEWWLRLAGLQKVPKSLINSIMDLPVMEEDLISSPFLARAGDPKGMGCYGWSVQITSAL